MPISVGQKSLLLKVFLVCLRFYSQQLRSSLLGQLLISRLEFKSVNMDFSKFATVVIDKYRGVKMTQKLNKLKVMSSCLTRNLKIDKER